MSQRSMNKTVALGLLVLRVGLGVMMMVHGYGKVMGGPELWAGLGGAMGHLGITFAPTFWGAAAAFSEFGGGFLLIIGLLTRPAAASLAFTMLVATVMHLANGDGIKGSSHSIEDGIAFLALILTGAGSYSLDALIFKKKA